MPALVSPGGWRHAQEYLPELQERAVRMVLEHAEDYGW
jgi:hypothetical protein